jgi:hypothetical protein
MALLVLTVWLVPIKNYRLPVDLPFSLEVYRLLIIVYVAAWAIGVASGTLRVDAGGLGKPVALLISVGVLSLASNAGAIADGHLTGQTVKTLSYFISFLVAYLLVHSTIQSIGAIELVLYALVIGAVLVSFSAFYESRTHYNLFHHLNNWVPFLKPARLIEQGTQLRGGRLRVTASAQHPIALGAALTMTVPFAFYLASRASDVVRSRFWILCGLVITAGAATTVSRTIVLMGIAMIAVGLYLRGDRVARYWPVLIVMAIVVHFGAPASISHLYDAFFPREGLTEQLNARAGSAGSGRLSDIAPGIRSLRQSPLFGHGLGTGSVRGSSTVSGPGTITDPKTGAPIIFDNQYMNSLVSIGVIGLLGVIWFVWGGTWQLIRGARRFTVDRRSDLVAACAIATAGFGAGMLAFDAFSFVQCTLLFFVIMALGQRALELE